MNKPKKPSKENAELLRLLKGIFRPDKLCFDLYFEDVVTFRTWMKRRGYVFKKKGRHV